MLVLLVVFAVAPPATSATRAGDYLLAEYMRKQALAIREKALLDVKDKETWLRVRDQRRRELFEMMGLDPLPPRTPLKATITGTITTPHYRVEKLHYQSIPGLYVTANLYLPLKIDKPAPAILYVCGHGASPGGNKATYQHHGAWFAENGYVCLIVDTLQLGEIAGLHHGTNRFNMWWWQSLGYTPAGIELWNGIRGVDYLESRPEVDRKRIGVTGRSGGGATSWWVMAADERIACGVPVAGLADIYAHLSEGYPGRLANGVIGGHCDCMYFVNTHRWDFIQVMALCAPRPLMLGNSDEDLIFPIHGYRRPAAPVKKLYEAMGAIDKFTLLETKGPHKDTPELRQGAFAWLNRWLKEGAGEVVQPERPRHDPVALKAITRTPSDAINDIVHERFLRPARVEMPDSPEVARPWWEAKSVELRQKIHERVFGGWPRSPGAIGGRTIEKTIDGIQVSAIDFDSENGVPLRTWLLRTGDPAEIIINVCDEKGWHKWLEELGPDFANLLYGKANPAPTPYPTWKRTQFQNLKRSMTAYGWAFAIVAPRGIGPTRWSDKEPQHVRRRFALLGQTLEGQQTWDIRRALEALPLGKTKVTLQAEGDLAVCAMYAALYEPRVSRLELSRLPRSHRSGPAFLNVLTILDLPQTVALLAPREVVIDGDAKDWQWPLVLLKKIGGKGLTVGRKDE